MFVLFSAGNVLVTYMTMLGTAATYNRKLHIHRLGARPPGPHRIDGAPTSGAGFGSETEAAARRGEGRGLTAHGRPSGQGAEGARSFGSAARFRQRGHTAAHGLALARPAASLELASRGPEKNREPRNSDSRRPGPVQGTAPPRHTRQTCYNNNNNNNDNNAGL